MTALDVITLEQAKAELVMTGISDRDAEITRLIQTAIGWVEQYTCYRLYERVETFIAYGCETVLPYYPITIDGVDHDGSAYANYKEKFLPLGLRIICPSQSTITATVGYSDVGEIPAPLIEAAYKLITYLFENKDVYSVQLPVDVQILINQYRRSPTI